MILLFSMEAVIYPVATVNLILLVFSLKRKASHEKHVFFKHSSSTCIFDDT